MTLHEAVIISAKKLDKIKPEWYKLVPLEDGLVDMRGQCCDPCVECILDHVFKYEENSIGLNLSGYSYAYNKHQDLVYGTGRCPFAADDALPFWKLEIAARLAVWVPVTRVEEIVEICGI